MPSLNARVDKEQHERFHKLAERLGTDLSSLIIQSLELISQQVESDGWESRRIWVEGNRVVMIGEQPPSGIRGMSAHASYIIVAPSLLWSHLEREVEKPG